MTEGTAVAKLEKASSVTNIISATGLDPDEWTRDRIALVRRILPTNFQDDINLMFFLAKVQATGLDPTSGEIWAWEQDGKVQTMTGRDGFILIARRDLEIEGLKHGLIYENDTFNASDDEGRIQIDHQMPAPRGGLMECYCVARMANGLDHIERRSLEDYRHLLNKSNWRNHPQDMLLARTIGACVRVVCPNARGVYSEADDFGEPVRAAQEVKLKTDEAAKALRARLTRPIGEVDAWDAEANVAADAPEQPARAGTWEEQPQAMIDAKHPGSVPGSVGVGMDAKAVDNGVAQPEFDCEFCNVLDGYTGPYAGQRAWAGHCRSKVHKAMVAEVEEAAAAPNPPEPEGATVTPEETTEDASAVSAEGGTTPTAPEGITTMDMYKEMDELIKAGRVHSDIVKTVLNDPEYAEMFGGFKRSDRDVVRTFDLNDEARLVLLKIIRGIASS